ncbi:hypothetical protein M1446_03645 [Candidatus Dependentiae bacterium]|nr:hypothetical protein [Candidatus Dependentiae bacterium]
MESGNVDIQQTESQIIPGLVDDVSIKIIEDSLQIAFDENPAKTTSIENSLEKIMNLLNQCANLMRTSKSFLSAQKFIDTKTIEILKQQDNKLLNQIFLQLNSEKKEIKDRLVLGSLLIQVGVNAQQTPLLDFHEKNREFVQEAIKQNDTRWLEFLLKTHNLHINYLINIRGVNRTFANYEQPLATAFKLVKNYPTGSLKVIQLLLDNGANPFSIPFDKKNNPKYKNIMQLYGPKKVKTIANPLGAYRSPEAAKIKELLIEFAKANPHRVIESRKAKEIVKKNGGLIF